MIDEFWLDRIRQANSNSAVNAFADLSELISSGRLSISDLRGLSGALRHLHQQAWDRANELRERQKRKSL